MWWNIKIFKSNIWIVNYNNTILFNIKYKYYIYLCNSELDQPEKPHKGIVAWKKLDGEIILQLINSEELSLGEVILNLNIFNMIEIWNIEKIS